jgi:uncharacterized protein with FMN-binding domain
MATTMTKRLMIPVATAAALAASALAGCGGQTIASSTPAVDQTSQTASPTTTVASSATGYADGTYQGASVAIRWGAVQVQAVIQGGKIASVEFVTYPTGDQRSQQINSQAAPRLVQEAIQAQSANVQVVSGATYTSQAFMQSLDAALDQAA